MWTPQEEVDQKLASMTKAFNEEGTVLNTIARVPQAADMMWLGNENVGQRLRTISELPDAHSTEELEEFLGPHGPKNFGFARS